MAPRHTMIASLTSQTKKAVLLVQATRIWESINSKSNKLIHTNVVFVDQEDSHILAIIYNNQKDTYFPLLKEGEVYTLTDFIVVAAGKEYRSVERDLALNFYHRTDVKPTVDTGSIPKHKFELTDLEKVPALLSKVKNFIDVIGMVDIYADAGHSSKGDKKLEVRLVNQRNNHIMVTLWEAKASQFVEALEAANGSAAFVVITGLIAKKISDDVVMSSRDGTKTYCNTDYAPLNVLRTDILAATGHKIESLPPPRKSGFMTAKPITLDEVTIQHILDAPTPEDNQVIRFLCKATIMEVSNYDGWFYNSCPKCTHGVHLRGGQYYCVSCPDPVHNITQRYRVKVVVQDSSGRTTFTLFRNQVEQLVGVPIEKIIGEIGQDKIDIDIPPVIKNMLGKVCLFEVRVNSYNKPGREGYTVTKLSESSVGGPPSGSAANEEVGTSKEHTGTGGDEGAASSKKQRLA